MYVDLFKPSLNPKDELMDCERLSKKTECTLRPINFGIFQILKRVNMYWHPQELVWYINSWIRDD